MTSSQIRASFLGYFEGRQHRVVRSSPLVPSDDPTLLFTNAGMNQFKDVFLGRERRDYKRAATSQKCMRVSGKHNDLENVGPSLRHHTFFEMLGNFSFGDYFKREAIAYAWELLTKEWRIPEDRLFATVFAGEARIPRDDEAYEVWRKFLPAERIGELGLADNFWSMGDTGPCGRCSEVHYFRGESVPCPAPICRGIECGCDRYIEIWNNVFMEFDRQADGSLVPLPAPSIDTGMGLERVTAVLQGTLSNYDTDLFAPLLVAVGDLAGRRYGGSMDPSDISMRVISDHARAMTFLIADGVVPSNEWRGYVLRKIMRRAMRHGKRLNLSEPFLYRLVDVLASQMGAAYPELPAHRDYIVQVIRSEEERFEAVLANGLPRLEELLEESARTSGVVPGEAAFKLYDTYGVPLDFIEDLAGERHLALDTAGFERAMEDQRAKARARSAFDVGKARTAVALESEATAEALRTAGDRFEGYETLVLRSVPIIALFDAERRQVRELTEGQQGYVAMERTPFYAEAGGQVSDAGRIHAENGTATAVVETLARFSPEWPRMHKVRVVAGSLRDSDRLTAEVDQAARDATRRNHTATHLLHAALRQVLGSHVKQAGSLVAPDRLRFDFVHFSPLTADEIDRVERLVNEQVTRNAAVSTEIKPAEDAIASGAMALFGEKYGDEVRVVSVPGFSQELCGGTHCTATGDIGFFTITEEGGIAAGVRRIEALTGAGAVRYYQERRRALDRLLAAVGAPLEQAPDAVAKLHGELKRLRREIEKATAESLREDPGGGPQVTEVGGVRLVTERRSGLSKEHLRTLADRHRSRIGSGVVVVASDTEGRVAVIAAVTPDLIGKVNAAKLIRAIAPVVGGGGGGRADFAEAGGRNAEKIEEMFSKAREVLGEGAAA
ncbi:MAG: alanine--tRNA ligase [Vicinamibacterales bacterium]